MHLKKWYFDLVTDSGTAFLCYSVGLVYKDWRLGYSAVMKGAFDHPFKATYSMQAPKPQVHDQEIIWTDPKTDAVFTWQNTNAFQTEPLTLWEDEHGSVQWHHLYPTAQARIEHQGQSLQGLGYAECLDLSILPWKLPLKRLRWGRFTSNTHALTWIEWQMQEQQNKYWAFYNGSPTEIDLLDQAHISCEQGHLHIQPGSAIREGYLRDTALSSVSLVSALLPQQVMDIHEAKRIAPAQLTLHSGEQISGWVIDEVVLFP